MVLTGPSVTRRRKYWGWGHEDEGLGPDERESLAGILAAHFSLADLTIREPARPEELDLPAPRLSPPSTLEPLCTTEPYERAAHAYGKSFRDVVRALRGEFPHPPDLVAFPCDEADVAALLDETEALVSGSGDGSRALLLVGFESADHPLDAWLARAVEICRERGGEVEVRAPREGAAGAWRQAFLRGPHVRDALVQLGMIAETFETAVTWDRFEPLHAGVIAAVREAAEDACGAGLVSCRLTHSYPDGTAPYYTVIAPGRPGAELEQWGEIKTAASEAILAHGGTITHHHAVGRDHRPWYDRERPPLFAEALRAAKAALDPAGILNPGVLLDPVR